MTPPLPRPTAFLLPPSGLEHDTGAGHPEHAGRLRAVAAAMDRARPGFGDRVEDLDGPPATLDDLLAVHAPDQIQRVREAAGIAEDRQVLVGLDPDTRVSPGSWTAAMDAAGAAIRATRAVSEGSHANAFVAARPPGHHATREVSMGFCLFNNVAVAARSLQRSGAADRILIVDWDVHHGNGTQDIFYADPSVCYVSLHQSPHYPGTGAAEESGAGEGRGLTINVPLPGGLDRDAYRRRFEDALDRATAAFTPDFVLVSAGFDVLAGDPLGGQTLEPADLANLTRSLLERSRAWCDGRMACLLEGGYVPERVGAGVVAVLRAMSGVEVDDAGSSDRGFG